MPKSCKARWTPRWRSLQKARANRKRSVSSWRPLRLPRARCWSASRSPNGSWRLRSARLRKPGPSLVQATPKSCKAPWTPRRRSLRRASGDRRSFASSWRLRRPARPRCWSEWQSPKGSCRSRKRRSRRPRLAPSQEAAPRSCKANWRLRRRNSPKAGCSRKRFASSWRWLRVPRLTCSSGLRSLTGGCRPRSRLLPKPKLELTLVEAKLKSCKAPWMPRRRSSQRASSVRKNFARSWRLPRRPRPPCTSEPRSSKGDCRMRSMHLERPRRGWSRAKAAPRSSRVSWTPRWRSTWSANSDRRSFASS
mmetsp:Transcript_26654/g.76802  ORF Transcript_26654/g.76802 Transcript_26654/m.76802 type:complete len:307 (+) Transcript_26654:807-1727(+)